MKKKIALGLAGIMMISALTGCGKSSSKYLLDVDYSDYVKLCEYKGVEATKVTFDISDEEVQEEVENQLYENATYEDITDRGVEIGDYANIDYTATIDGEISEDYSGEDEEYMIGEEFFYPEAEEAMVGMKTGETKKVEVELTEDFADEEDIGKKVSLEITLNGISVENLPEYNEEYVKENTDFDSIEAYEASLKEELMASKEETYKYSSVEEIISYIMKNSTFDGYPEELYTQCEENYDSSNEYSAASYGMELEDYLSLFGIDEATRKTDIEYSVNYDLVIGAIAQAEEIDCTEDEVDQFVEKYYQDYGYESTDEFLADYEKEDVGYEIIYEKVADFLYENAKYNEMTEEEYMAAKPDEFEYMEEDEEEAQEEEIEETDVQDSEDADSDVDTDSEEEESAESADSKEDEAAEDVQTDGAENEINLEEAESEE